MSDTDEISAEEIVTTELLIRIEELKALSHEELARRVALLEATERMLMKRNRKLRGKDDPD